MRKPHLRSLKTLALLLGAGACAGPAGAAATKSYIVEARTTAAAGLSAASVGGVVERKLDIIHSVVAQLTPQQALQVGGLKGVRVFEDRELKTQASSLAALTSAVVSAVSSSQTLSDGTAESAPTLLYQTDYVAQVGADSLQQAGITGKGVTIAVLDTGLWMPVEQQFSSRVLASVDETTGGSAAVTGDPYGHGTHITSIAAGGAQNINGGYFGIAPKANLVIVRAFDDTGAGSYTKVIAGLNWIVQNRTKYKIRVLNLSFGAPPQSNYWQDPLNQAVMAVWKAGVVVVAAAGNEGPNPMTIDVPGNVPYIITAGAITDNFTPYTYSDDRLASFSSTGPTYEGFVKPELVAPGGHMVRRDAEHQLSRQH